MQVYKSADGFPLALLLCFFLRRVRCQLVRWFSIFSRISPNRTFPRWVCGPGVLCPIRRLIFRSMRW
nr:MAG TPA: hypothetical protein [Caudoviricetes sp.]DAV11941.1 MAG TPA: hypothetical protein [Caudoviricetes sp.]